MLNLLLNFIKHWGFISSTSLGSSLLAFIGGLKHKIGWELSLVLAFFAGLIGLILIFASLWCFYKFKNAKEKGAIREQAEEDRKLEELKSAQKQKEIEKQAEEERKTIEVKEEVDYEFKTKEKVDDVLTKFGKKEYTEQEVRATIIGLARNLPKERENLEESINEMVKALYPSQELSVEQKDIFYTSLEAYYKPFRKNINKLIEEKILPLIPQGKISKQTTQFLNSITDADLDLIKEQFSYVANAEETKVRYGILFSFAVAKKLIKEVNLEFPQMWSNLNERAVKNGSIPIKLPPLKVVNPIFKSNFSLQLTNLNKKEAEYITMFCTLSHIGLELYNILEDEIPETSLDYIEDLAEYINNNPYSSIEAEIVDAKNNPLSQK